MIRGVATTPFRGMAYMWGRKASWTTNDLFHLQHEHGNEKMIIMICRFASMVLLQCLIVLTSCSGRMEMSSPDHKSAPQSAPATRHQSTAKSTDMHLPRRLGQLRMDARLMFSDVTRAWGPPDAQLGSGAQIFNYHLEDGSSLLLRFGGNPYYLIEAVHVRKGMVGQEREVIFRIGPSVDERKKE